MQELQKFIKTAVHFYLANEVNFFLWGGGGGGGEAGAKMNNNFFRLRDLNH